MINDSVVKFCGEELDLSSDRKKLKLKILKIVRDNEIDVCSLIESKNTEYNLSKELENNKEIFFKLLEEIFTKNSIIKYRAKNSTAYFTIDKYGDIECEKEYGLHFDDILFLSGNYFETEEEAKESKLYKILHEMD